jgi:hypothetical protein
MLHRARYILLGVLLLGRPAAWAGGADWPLVRGDAAGSGWGAGAGIQPPLAPAFQVPMEEGWAGLVVEEGVIYATTRTGHVHALSLPRLDRPMLQQKWSYRTGGRIVAAPAVADGTVFVASRDHQLYALETEQGTLRWKRELGGDLRCAPLAVGGRVYIGSDDHCFYAVDAATGEEVWEFVAQGDFRAAAALRGQTLFVGNTDHHLYALGVPDGQLLWAADLGDNVESPPAAGATAVYVISRDGVLRALDLRDGHLLWQASERVAGRGAPALLLNEVYATSPEGRILAFEATSGKLLWASATAGLASSPILLNITLYAVNAAGQLTLLPAGPAAPGPAVEPVHEARSPFPCEDLPAALAAGSGFLCGITPSQLVVYQTAEGEGGSGPGNWGGDMDPTHFVDSEPVAYQDLSVGDEQMAKRQEELRRSLSLGPQGHFAYHTFDGSDRARTWLDGRLSYCSRGEKLVTYFWYEPFSREPRVRRLFGRGTHHFLLIVRDEEGAAAVDDHFLTVVPRAEDPTYLLPDPPAGDPPPAWLQQYLKKPPALSVETLFRR